MTMHYADMKPQPSTQDMNTIRYKNRHDGSTFTLQGGEPAAVAIQSSFTGDELVHLKCDATGMSVILQRRLLDNNFDPVIEGEALDWKPCPFCGAADWELKPPPGGPGKLYILQHADGCYLAPQGFIRQVVTLPDEHLRAAWNTRSGTPSSPSRRQSSESGTAP